MAAGIDKVAFRQQISDIITRMGSGERVEAKFLPGKGTNKYVKNHIYWQFFVLSDVSPTASVRARVCAYI